MSENFLELFHFFLSVAIVVTAAGGFITKKKILMEPNKKRCSDINTGCTFLETFFKFIYISVCKQGYLRRNHALLIHADFHIH